MNSDRDDHRKFLEAVKAYAENSEEDLLVVLRMLIESTVPSHGNPETTVQFFREVLTQAKSGGYKKDFLKGFEAMISEREDWEKRKKERLEKMTSAFAQAGKLSPETVAIAEAAAEAMADGK